MPMQFPWGMNDVVVLTLCLLLERAVGRFVRVLQMIRYTTWYFIRMFRWSLQTNHFTAVVTCILGLRRNV